MAHEQSPTCGGIDLSGLRHSAGGVGGLLMAASHGSGGSEYYAWSDGNGNVVGGRSMEVEVQPIAKYTVAAQKLKGFPVIPAYVVKAELDETVTYSCVCE